jgi:hypothetical protein
MSDTLDCGCTTDGGSARKALRGWFLVRTSWPGNSAAEPGAIDPSQTPQSNPLPTGLVPVLAHSPRLNWMRMLG